MRVVIDTNILISALISPGGLPDLLYQLWRAKKFDLVSSEWQLAEFRRVSRNPGIKDYFKPHTAGRLVGLLRKNAIVLDELPDIDYSPYKDDNPILAAAIKGDVQYVITGDKNDLLELERVNGIPIVTVRQFISQFVQLGG